MTDPSKPTETADDLDLEDGEIETDDDEAEVVIVEDKNVSTENKEANAIKNPFAQNPKNDTILSPVHKARESVKDKGVDG